MFKPSSGLFRACKSSVGVHGCSWFKTKSRHYSKYHPISDITFKTVLPEGPVNPQAVPLVILHGLFGSYMNFSTFARQYSRKYNTKIYLLNLRNHSDPQNHSSVMNFVAMASDLDHFMYKQNIQECDLFGFSLGGKTSMAACLGTDFKSHVSDRVRKLVVGDISPLPLRDGDWDIPHVMDALVLLDKQLPQIKTRNEADDFLKQYISSVEVRSFLLSNLKKNENSQREGLFDWKFNLSGIASNLSEIADFPFKTPEIVQEMHNLGYDHVTSYPWTPFEKPTLFLKGETSPLINTKSERTIRTISTFFPNYNLYQFDGCSHWIHAEKYALFFSKMEEFLEGSVKRE